MHVLLCGPWIEVRESQSTLCCTAHSVAVKDVNRRYVAWPLELGLGTLNPRFVVWRLELRSRDLNSRFVAWPLELGLRTRIACFIAMLRGPLSLP